MISRPRTLTALAVAVITACVAARANASSIVSIQSVTVAAGSSANGIDVELTNTGPSALSIGGFSFEISIATLDVSFTGADTFTTAAYIFGGNSLFGPILAAPASGQSLLVSDIFAIPFSGATLGAGATVGLGRVLFDVSPFAAGGVFSVSLTPFPITSLSDELGNDVPIDVLSSGQITISAPQPSAVPEPSSLLLLASGIAVGMRRRHRK